MRTIRVTGKGQIKVRPDMMRIAISLEGICPDYAEALQRSSRDTEHLKEVLSAFGFKRDDIKTLNFSVDADYESYRDKGVYKQRLVGYRYRHVVKVEFESDNDRLGKVLYALAHCTVQPEFRISYTVKDPETTKNALLSKAVSDAKDKAAVLTCAAGVILKDIQSIDYSWGEIDFEVRPMNQAIVREASMDMEASSYAMDIEPDDIEASDTVTVLWEIG